MGANSPLEDTKFILSYKGDGAYGPASVVIKFSGEVDYETFKFHCKAFATAVGYLTDGEEDNEKGKSR